MAFPQDPLPIVGELFINGAWVDITKDIRADESVQITNRGNTAEGPQLSSSSAAFKLNNGASKVTSTLGQIGVYSNRNPYSPYYGKLPRNTPVRFSIADGITSYRAYPVGNKVAYAQTADKNVLDVTGDIDVRVDIDLASWRGATGTMLISKYVSGGNQRSWYMNLTPKGQLQFTWSTDGTVAGAVSIFTNLYPKPGQSGRKVVRVTIDVDNGASGHVITFYTGDNIVSGPWTGIGSLTRSGVTSIFNSTSPLAVGSASNGLNTSVSGTPLAAYGEIYRAQLYNGIGGTLVADFNPATQSAGVTSWSDGLGTPNTWNIVGDGASLQSGLRRYYGELSSMPVEWDSSGKDVYVRVTAGDATRRLTQGADTLHSSMYRYITGDLSAIGTINGYWPMEDAAGSSQAAGVLGPYPAYAGGITFGGNDIALPSSMGFAEFLNDTSLMYASAGVPTGTPTTTNFTWLMRMVTRPATEQIVMFIRGSGIVVRWQIYFGATTVRVRGITADGTIYIDSAITDGQTPQNNWIICSLSVEAGMAGTDWELRLAPVVPGGSFGGSVGGNYAGDVGYFTSWKSGSGSYMTGVKLAQVFSAVNVPDRTIYTSTFYSACVAFINEAAGTRLERLAREEGVNMHVIGSPTDTKLMGYQLPAKLQDLFLECVAVDDGIMYPSRKFFGYEYRTRRSLQNQDPVVLNYTNKELSGELRPVEDDLLLVNDFTASRPLGSEARSERYTGPLGINTARRYASNGVRNANTDAALQAQSEEATFLGTWDEARYPNVQVQLERAPFLANPTKSAALARVDVGGLLRIDNLPAWLPPDPVELLVRGINVETLSNRGWSIKYNCSPGGPFRVNDTTVTPTYTVTTLGKTRAAATNTTLSSALAAFADNITFTVSTPTGALWSNTADKPGNFPQDIMINGERITISAIFGSVTTQTFQIPTGGRGKNGVNKAHIIGEPVQVFDLFYAVL